MSVKGTPMVFRFLCAFVLFVAITAFGLWIERENLALNRNVSRQHYQRDILEEEVVRLKSDVEQLGVPSEALESTPEKENE